jgi:hypothetical protein
MVRRIILRGGQCKLAIGEMEGRGKVGYGVECK